MSTTAYALHPRPERQAREDRSGRLRSGRSRVLTGLGACLLVGAAAGYGAKTGIAALVAVAVVLVVLHRPVIGAFILALLVPATSGLRRGFPVPALRVSEAMIALLAGLILLAAKSGSTPRWRAFDWLALGYVLVTAAFGYLDLKSRGGGVSTADEDKLLGPLQFFLLYRAVLTAVTSGDQRRTALRLILIASVPVSLLAIFQQAHVAGVPRILANITGSQAYFENVGVPRATGPFVHWHDLGSYLFVVILLGVALLVGGSGRVLGRKSLLLIVALAAIALVNTVSFTPIAGTAVGCLLLMPLAQQPQRWVGAVAVALIVVGVVFAPLLEGRYHEQFGAHAPVKQYPYLPQNVNFRIAVWTNQYFPVIRQHLVTGYGPDHPASIPFSYTETIYVTLLLRGGVPLLIVYAALMVALALGARDVKDDPDRDRRALARVMYLVVALSIFMQLLTNYFVNAGFPHLFWILAALLFIEGNRRRGDSRLRPSRTT